MVDIHDGQKRVYRIGSDKWAYTVLKVIKGRKILVRDNRCHKGVVFTLRKGQHYANLGYLDFSITETKLDKDLTNKNSHIMLILRLFVVDNEHVRTTVAC